MIAELGLPSEEPSWATNLKQLLELVLYLPLRTHMPWIVNICKIGV